MRIVSSFLSGVALVAGSSLSERFQHAVEYVKNDADPSTSSYEAKLECYALFKQATAGDAKAPASVVSDDSLANQKLVAWRSKEGLSKEDAMQAYIDLITAHFPDWEKDV